MSALLQRRPAPGRVAGRIAALAAASALTLVPLAGPASANPGDGGPGGSVGVGDVYITSSTTVAEGQKVSFAGEGFALGGSAGAPAAQVLSVKLDAAGPTAAYTGSAADSAGVVGTYQLQADGTVSGSLVIPADIDDPAVNPASADGPHFLRFLGGNPATSRWSEDFEVDAAAPVAPTVTATSAVASSRGTFSHTITVTGSGLTSGESVSVREALAETGLKWTLGSGSSATQVDTIAADAGGNLSGRIVVGAGVIAAGEHQLVLGRSSAPGTPAVVQVTVSPLVTFAGLALDSDGTVTVANAAPGATFTSVKLDPSAEATSDEVEVLQAPITADSTGVATGAVHVPDGAAYLGTKTLTTTQGFPYAKTYTASAKVSPSTATFGEEGYGRVATADGAIEQGLYQSAYSAESDALFVTTANVTTTSRIYRLDPDTLAVEASVQPAYVDGTSGPLWAAYGIGVDDEHGTVWVTNTRQNTVAVYDQDDLSLLRQLPAGTISHSRDVVVDTVHDLVFASSASEGSSGDGYISVFEAADNDGDGTAYEFIQNIATYPRTTFSPMSLELDEESGKLFTVSLTTQAAMVVDTATLDDTIIPLPDLMTGGRGASGVAYDGETNRLFVASQNSDELLIAQLDDQLTTGTTIAEVPTGAGALNVAFDPVHRLAYVANFGGTTITVVDSDGAKVANLPFSRANHVAEDGQGSVFAVNKDTGNQVVKLSPILATAKPTISGTAQVGKTLTADAGAWAEEATLAYQWLRGDAPIAGADAATYRLKAADVGERLRVAVTGTAEGFEPATETSEPTQAVVKGELKAGKPTVAGMAKVGKKLTARPGSWTAGSKLSFQWYAGAKPVAKAHGKTLTLTKKLQGDRISVKVTGTKPGYQTVAAKSAPTAKVKPAKKRRH